MPPRVLLSFVLLVAPTLSGCAFPGEPAGALVEPGPKEIVAWRVDLPRGSESHHEVGLGDDRVYVVIEGPPAEIRAFAAADGTSLWSRPLPMPCGAPHALATQVIALCGEEDKTLVAFEGSNGELAWERALPPASRAPLVAEGMLLLREEIGQKERLSAFDVEGKETWSTDIPTHAPIQALGDLLFVPHFEGLSVRAMDPRSGRVLWSTPDAILGQANDILTPAIVTVETRTDQGEPQDVGGGLVLYDSSSTETIVGRSAQDGSVLWSFEIGPPATGRTGMWVGSSTLYDRREGTITAYALPDARKVGEWPLPSDAPVQAETIGDRIFLLDLGSPRNPQPSITTVARDATLQSWAWPDASARRYHGIAGSLLYFSSWEGELVAIDPRALI